MDETHQKPIRILELISLLEKLEREHGNLRVVTGGFDESGKDDIEVGLTAIIPHDNISKMEQGHGGRHENAEIGDTGTELVVEINFSVWKKSPPS